jgi:hypothetical protein
MIFTYKKEGELKKPPLSMRFLAVLFYFFINIILNFIVWILLNKKIKRWSVEMLDIELSNQDE